MGFNFKTIRIIAINDRSADGSAPTRGGWATGLAGFGPPLSTRKDSFFVEQTALVIVLGWSSTFSQTRLEDRDVSPWAPRWINLRILARIFVWRDVTKSGRLNPRCIRHRDEAQRIVDK
jgi:hypothetical protein